MPGILPEGATLLVGKGKVGKSWLTLAIAIAVGTGGRVLGQIAVEQGDVLYLALEDSRKRMQSRTEIVLGANAPCPRNVEVFFQWEPFDRGGFARLDQYLTEHAGISLVVIDTLQRIRPAHRGSGSYTYAEDYQIASALSYLGHKHHVAILTVYHIRKAPSDDPQDLVSGTTGLTGGVDGTIVLTKPRGENVGALFMVGREVEEQQHAIHWTPQTRTWVIMEEVADAIMLPNRQRLILDVFKMQDNPTLTIDGVCAGLGMKQPPKPNDKHRVEMVMGRMANDGVLQRVGKGYYHAAARYIYKRKRQEDTEKRDSCESREVCESYESRESCELPAPRPNSHGSHLPEPKCEFAIVCANAEFNGSGSEKMARNSQTHTPHTSLQNAHLCQSCGSVNGLREDGTCRDCGLTGDDPDLDLDFDFNFAPDASLNFNCDDGDEDRESDDDADDEDREPSIDDFDFD